MKTILVVLQSLLVFIITIELGALENDNSIYFQEKYFRFLANNYDEIQQGTFWTSFGDEKGIGFKAKSDFGSFILVKDWSMFSFKLTKIVFRPFCSYKLAPMPLDAEMLLIHTLDNGYYPPGKRMYLGVNYLVISVPFKITADSNPANDKLFKFISLAEYNDLIASDDKNKWLTRISPLKPIKLHHIIQHQPSYLFTSFLPFKNEEKALYLVFSQYHYISKSDYEMLNATHEKIFNLDEEAKKSLNINLLDVKYYRNWENKNATAPKPTLMAYNSQLFIKISSLILFIIIALLF